MRASPTLPCFNPKHPPARASLLTLIARRAYRLAPLETRPAGPKQSHPAHPMEPKYGGMTVNERLYVSGLMDAFDKAVSERNIGEVVRILKSVEVGEESLQPILDRLGLRGS